MRIKCFSTDLDNRLGLKGLTKEEQIKRVSDYFGDEQLRKRQNKIQAIVVNDAWSNIEQGVDVYRKLADKRKYTGTKKEEFIKNGYIASLKAFLYTDRMELFGRGGLESKMLAINAASQSKVSDMMEEFMPRLMGLEPSLRSKAYLKKQENFIRVLFGEETSDPKFGKFAKDWNGLIEDLRLRFNRAGGDINKLKIWRVPQKHDASIIRNAGFDEWYKDIRSFVDIEEMGLSQGDDIQKLFKNAYDEIVSEGIITSDTKGFLGTGALANRHEKSRFFKFKDSSSFMQYLNKYTDETPYSVMMDHVTMISNEIGLMENLGPDADAGMRVLSSEIIKATGDKASANFANKAYINLSGKTHPTNRKFADRAQALRNVVTGLKLPSAALSAIPDVMFNAMTARYNGIPTVGVMKRFIRGLKFDSPADRKLAAKLWFPLDHMLDEAHAAMRFSDVAGHKSSARFSQMIMRGSGLTAWTTAGKRAFHEEFMSTLADAEWSKGLNSAFKRYGISKAEQKVILDSKKLVHNGIDYVDPENLPPALAEKVAAMVISETKYAVPEGDLLVRTIMNQGSKKGELPGEIMRSAGMFKTFMATIITNHWARAAHGFEGNKISRMQYMSSMLIGTWVMGTFSIQLKEIAAGREPIDWDNPELWKKGFWQGGSLSILGDMWSSDSRSFGSSVQDFIGGPLLSEVDKLLWEGLLKETDDWVAKEKTVMDSLKELPGVMADYVPGQFWYSKAIMNRAFLDSMRKFSDPEWELKQIRRENKRYRELKNERFF